MFKGLYAGRRILITGHNGFKGSWLSYWLQELGADIYGLSLPISTRPNHFELLIPNMPGAHIDLADFQTVQDLMCSFQPELVFHLAAQSLVRRSYREPLLTLQSNVMGSANLLQAARACPALKGLVIVSSDKCYQNQEWPWGYRENEALGGHDPYSTSKACTELLVNCWRDSFFNPGTMQKPPLLASARAGNVIGGGDWAEDRIVPSLIGSAIGNESVNLRSPKALRPWQHVLEALSAYLLLGQKMLEGDGTVAQAWNFGPDDNQPISVLKMAESLQKHWPKINFTCQPEPDAPHEAHILRLDSSKARLLLQWHPVWDAEQTFARCANWYRHYYEKGELSTADDLQEYCRQAKQKGLAWTL
ncbi:MAG: CDP-glucose 4,6-dehydratase [Oligosphaeraceae bacterium]|nr:CDP-glucose 4,6-dehydratase [Oligosphaeraceae bacterium]